MVEKKKDLIAAVAFWVRVWVCVLLRRNGKRRGLGRGSMPFALVEWW